MKEGTRSIVQWGINQDQMYNVLNIHKYYVLYSIKVLHIKVPTVKFFRWM